MAWIYLAELVESVSLSKSGCDQSPIVRTTDTLKQCFYHVWDKDNCQQRQSGMTLERLGAEISWTEAPVPLTSLSADFHARTFLVQELERVWRATEADFSLSSSDSFAIYDHDSFSWKTCQLSLFEDLSGFSWSSLRWGMTRAGRLYQPQNLEPVICDNAGSSLPTPTAKEGGTNKSRSPNAAVRPQLSTVAKTLPTPMARDWKGSGGKNRNSVDLPRTMGGPLNPQFVEELMGYPIGWTESADWAMQWYRCKQEKRLLG